MCSVAWNHLNSMNTLRGRVRQKSCLTKSTSDNQIVLPTKLSDFCVWCCNFATIGATNISRPAYCRIFLELFGSALRLGVTLLQVSATTSIGYKLISVASRFRTFVRYNCFQALRDKLWHPQKDPQCSRSQRRCQRITQCMSRKGTTTARRTSINVTF